MNIGNRLLSADDNNKIIACADLVGRSGARNFEIGYLHDDGPSEKAGWYAHAQYRGARLISKDQPGPSEAAQDLATRVLTGAKCRCGRLVALDEAGATFLPGAAMADGSTWTFDEAMAAGQCLWRLQGQRWEPSCPVPEGRL